ncbi:hypothetical protein [Loigolactobacillus jiayinensis]|nr:hypothetical protein [Loigolactobacillus jiayinensis]
MIEIKQKSVVHDLVKLLFEDMKTIYDMDMYIAQIKDDNGIIAQLIAETFRAKAASHTMINSIVRGTKTLRDNGLTTEETATVFTMRLVRITNTRDLATSLEYGVKQLIDNEFNDDALTDLYSCLANETDEQREDVEWQAALVEQLAFIMKAGDVRDGHLRKLKQKIDRLQGSGLDREIIQEIVRNKLAFKGYGNSWRTIEYIPDGRISW